MKYAPVPMLFCVAALCACNGDGGRPAAPTAAGSSQSKPAPPVRKGPSAADQTAGMVEAASQGESTVPVQLKFELPQKPQIGQELQVNIAVMPQIPASPADIQVTGAEGLQVAPEESKIEIPNVEEGEVYRETVKATPTADGVLFLGLTVLLKHDDITESRSFAIPLIVDR